MTTPNNLPAELTSFVGREPQLAELRRLLHRSRLITLTGPGGAGKSRLALRLATDSLDRFPDGVRHLDLAPIGDRALLEQSLAAVCGITEEPKRSVLEVVADRLRDSRTLLVFDGCEHLVDACAELTSQLLRACPKLAILATSREPLGVTGEVIWRTPSLTLPRLEDAAHRELLMESEAIRLFIDRARLSRPDFEVQPSSAGVLAQICMRLEGIPLAIELAAGLAGMMTLQEILDRLSHRFRLLTGGSRSSLPRHQTLRQAVDWSYGLLSPTEQALFARLAVFAGGFDLAAAEAVVHGDAIDPDDVLPTLSRLVKKSLVVAEPGRPHATRYRMLDTIREYAVEKLQQVGETAWRQSHADYFSDWTVHAVKQLDSTEQMTWLLRIEEELANLRLALEWSFTEHPDSALALAVAMGTIWWMRRTPSEAFEWLTRTLDAETSNPEARAGALMWRARLSRRMRGDYATARRDAEECAAIARTLALPHLLEQAVTMLGIVASSAGDLTNGSRYFQEAHSLAAEIGDQYRLASSLNNMAMLESELGYQDSALRHVEEASSLAEQMGNRFMRATILDTVARVNYRLGNRDLARSSWAEGMTISAGFGDSVNIADCLDGMALLAISAADASRAIVLVSAATALRALTGVERTLPWTTEVLEAEAKATTKLGRSAAEAARRRGAAMSMRDAVEFALGIPATDRVERSTLLTERETEVARLIASGLTNGEVAGKLGISGRTVDAHVEHIRNKLGLRTRAQIAVWAHERIGTA